MLGYKQVLGGTMREREGESGTGGRSEWEWMGVANFRLRRVVLAPYL